MSLILGGEGGRAEYIYDCECPLGIYTESLGPGLCGWVPRAEEGVLDVIRVSPSRERPPQ